MPKDDNGNDYLIGCEDTHGNPFRYCSCGWMEEAKSVELTDSQKLEFLYQVAVKADKLMQEIGPQVGPILESASKNPMLKMFMR
jgi:hypothetical protein